MTFLFMRQIFYGPQPPSGLPSTRSAIVALRCRSRSSSGASRLVVHIQTSEAAVDDFLGVVRALAEEKRAAGFVKPEGHADNAFKDVYVSPAA